MTREEFKDRIGAAEDGQTVILEDDGLTVSVEDGAGEGEILVTADIGLLPADAAERGLPSRMMAANDCFAETAGGTISIDPETSHVALQITIWLDELDFDTAMARIGAVVDKAVKWKAVLHPAEGGPDGAGEPVDGSWMIQV